MPRKTKNKAKLLPHERSLLEEGKLLDITHPGSTSTWLYAENSPVDDHSASDDGFRYTLCYRHMGDVELSYLLKHNQLPNTQPYQTLTRGQEGRNYCEKYLRSNKTVNTDPTTVVEFSCPTQLIDEMFALQSKIEDGTISHGLGDKAGKTLHRFNDSLADGSTPKWRIVLVKRRCRIVK